MKTTIKFAALGALALAASSTAALAGSQTLPGLTTGIPLAPALPEGVYDLSIGVVQQQNAGGGIEAGIPDVADLVDTVVDRWRPYPTRRHNGLGKR